MNDVVASIEAVEARDLHRTYPGVSAGTSISSGGST